MIDQLEGTALSGTNGAQQPFFSPDGRWIAFVAGRKLKKVAVVGGAPLTLCDVDNFRGGSWGPDETIVFAPDTSAGLLRVPASGGVPEELTLPGEGERSHRWPRFLPDGRALLFTVQEQGGNFDEATVEILDLESKERRVLRRGGSNPAYVPTGHLVYVHEGTMFAVAFDLKSRQVSGSAAPVLEGISFEASNGGARFHFSPAGHLLFSGGGARGVDVTLSWLGSDGARTPALAESGAYRQFSISPDGTKLAVDVAGESSKIDIWIHDFTRDTLTRLTFAEATSRNSRWSPDGSRIYFSSERDGAANVYSKRADGTGEVVRLNESDIAHWVHDVSADGKTLLAARDDPETGWDIVALDTDGNHELTDFLATEHMEILGQMSPDGRWVAYGSNESDEFQIYVRPYPAGPGKWQISTDGANGFPRWSPDGRELYYRRGDDLLVAEVSGNGPSFVAQKPRVVFEDALGGTRFLHTWDVHPDGQRFLVTDRRESETGDRTHAILVLNWFDELKRRAPVLSGGRTP
jgi:serine/threonine-protein kinase